MNVVYVSPHFPRTYWMFCRALKRDGANVLGIGDCSYNELSDDVRRSLTEYYKVGNMEDYDQMYRAVAYFAHKYGKIDWLESNNEYWLEQDARLRTDFNIQTGEQLANIKRIKKKSSMKAYYEAANVPTARLSKLTTWEAAQEFIGKVGYPIVVKPNRGIGACDTYKIKNNDELGHFFGTRLDIPYVMEEYVDGDIVSYEAVLDSKGDPLMESCTYWPPSIMNIVTDQLDLYYYVAASVPPELLDIGRRTVKGFAVKSRFVHLEFFKLRHDKEGLGKAGDFVGLEVNMRPPGGYTPDMMNFAHSTDFYQLWADMLVHDSRVLPDNGNHRFCAYAGRRDQFEYVHSDDEVRSRYGNRIVMSERMPEMMVPQMGNRSFTVVLDSEDEVREFIHFVIDRR